MFGIGMPEMLMILAVALIVIGPKKLPDLAKSLGRALGEFKRATGDLKSTIQSETGLDEVRDSIREAKTDVRDALSLEDSTSTPIGAFSQESSKPDSGDDESKASTDGTDVEEPSTPSAADSPPSRSDAESRQADAEMDTPPKAQDAPADG